METITSRRNPLVDRCRALARDRRAHGADILDVLLDGLHLVTDARAAGVAIDTAIFGSRVLETNGAARLARELQRAGVRVARASADVMEAMSPVRSPSGVVAIARFELTPLERALAGKVPLVVGLLDVQDPGNLGAVIRAADAGGATGVVICGGSADPLGWKAVRGSMGSVFRIPITYVAEADAALSAMRQRGIRLVATRGSAPTPLYAARLAEPVALLFGNEGSGLPSAIVSQADEIVSVPMRRGVDSLNVSVTAALFVYEAYRQRHPGGR